jgi:hypothetical protein
MPKRFVYFYFMKNESERIREIVPSHIDYWKTSGMKNYLEKLFRWAICRPDRRSNFV